MIEPDGGMPGKTEEERLQATVLALLQFLAGGHSERGGAFRAHVKRLVKFLERSNVRADIVKMVIERARSGRAVEGDWSKRKPGPELWQDLAAALRK